MLNFKNTTIIFLFLLVATISYQLAFGLHLSIFILLFLAYSFLLFWGSYFVGSQFYMKVICNANTTEKKIAITFDDGPADNFTSQILNILKEQNLRAAFFCIGKQVATNRELLKRIHDEGHIIGNHSYNHSFWFDLLSSKKMQRDLQQMHDAVRQQLNIEIKWFRPPYGVTNPNLKKAVKQMNYTAIGWNVRSMDTVITDEKKLLLKMKKELKPGAIFLFHDTCKSTALMLPQFLQYVKEKGYEIVPLNKLLNLQPV